MTPAQLDQLERELVTESGRRFGAAVLAGKVRRIITENDADRDRQIAELGTKYVIERRIVSPPADGKGVQHANS
jgi:hypothetical protein